MCLRIVIYWKRRKRMLRRGWGGVGGYYLGMILQCIYIRKEEILKQFPIARFLNLINVCVSVCACVYTVGVGVGE